MIVKITDGESSHYIQVNGGVHVQQVPHMRPDDWGDFDLTPEVTAEWLRLITVDEDDRPEIENPGVVIRPEGVPLRTYLTNYDAYLLSESGKTLEVLHRAK